MAFTRESLAVYEKSPPPAAAAPAAAATTESAPAPVVQESVAAAPAEATDTSTASSATDVSADSADPSDDGTSAETGDSATPPADSDSATQESSTEGDGTPTAPRKGSAQERIQELVDERNALREYGKYMAEKVAELAGAKKEPAATTETAPAPQAATDEPPTLESCGFDQAAWSKALSKWTREQVDKGVASRFQQEKSQQTAEQVKTQFEARADKVRETNPDFDTVVANPKLPKLAPDAVRVVLKSEMGPAVLYHLGKNPDVATRISKMDPDLQAAAIGRLEAQLAAPKTPAPAAKPTPKPVHQKTVTKAPPPPQSVRGSVSPEKDISQMSMEEFVAHDRAQKLAKREARKAIGRAMR
jgi:hypothetical protein